MNPKFKVGDVVSTPFGSGVIVSFETNMVETRYNCKINGHGGWIVYEDELEKIEEEEYHEKTYGNHIEEWNEIL